MVSLVQALISYIFGKQTEKWDSKLLGAGFSKMFLMELWYQGQYFMMRLQYFLKKTRIYVQKLLVYNPPSSTYRSSPPEVFL